MLVMPVDPVVAKINRSLGRKLRVLHIGNIANNAYNNARIQRQYGIEADVLCHDYYHVMATPEWEDGDLTSSVDPNLPNWWDSNLNGFRRPDWYVQGPLALCLDYLDALRRGQKLRRRITAIAIEDVYIDLLRIDATMNGKSWRDPRSFWQLRSAPLSAAQRFLVRILMRTIRAPLTLASIPVTLRRRVLWPILVAAVAKPTRISGAPLILSTYHIACRALGRSAEEETYVARYAAENLPPEAKISWLVALAAVASLSLRGLLLAFPSILIFPCYWFSTLIGRTGRPKSLRKRRKIANQIAVALLDRQKTAEAAGDLSRRWLLERQIAKNDLTFGPILKHYDVVQGYSINGLIPLVNDHPAFASYEHGTLRELPFEDSLAGLICRVAYTNSPAVFVTNTDVLPSIERLGLDPARVHYLPHAFDDQKLMQWRDTHPELAPPADQVVFFSPTRQHWRDANRSLTKGNDVMLRAAGRLWADGRRFQLVLVEWGRDVAETNKLIEELGFTEAVRWVHPMGKHDLWRTYCTSHAVLDQFILPALGGVGFETLALARRLITRTDQPTLARFFGAAPPVLPAATIDEVAASLAHVLDDPADHAGLGCAGSEWIRTYHSARRTVAIQARVYSNLLGLAGGQIGNPATDTSDGLLLPAAERVSGISPKPHTTQ